MIRTLWAALSLCCVMALLSELVGAGFLWSQGLLSSAKVREIRELFESSGRPQAPSAEDAQAALPSSQDVLRERSLRVLSLNSLQTEVGLLKTMLENERAGLTAQSTEFEQQKTAFKKQLQQLADENSLAAREQARSVLQSLPPAEAVERLMQLSADENVLLMREMPEAKIAALLKEFAPAPENPEAAANVPKALQERARRAKEIFERIAKGEPRDSIIRSALNGVRQAEGDRK